MFGEREKGRGNRVGIIGYLKGRNQSQSQSQKQERGNGWTAVSDLLHTGHHTLHIIHLLHYDNRRDNGETRPTRERPKTEETMIRTTAARPGRGLGFGAGIGTRTVTRARARAMRRKPGEREAEGGSYSKYRTTKSLQRHGSRVGKGHNASISLSIGKRRRKSMYQAFPNKPRMELGWNRGVNGIQVPRLEE